MTQVHILWSISDPVKMEMLARIIHASKPATPTIEHFGETIALHVSPTFSIIRAEHFDYAAWKVWTPRPE